VDLDHPLPSDFVSADERRRRRRRLLGRIGAALIVFLAIVWLCTDWWTALAPPGVEAYLKSGRAAVWGGAKSAVGGAIEAIRIATDEDYANRVGEWNASLDAAREAYDQGDYGAAREAYQNAAGLMPKRPLPQEHVERSADAEACVAIEALLLEGKRLLEAGEARKALDKFRTVKRQHGEHRLAEGIDALIKQAQDAAAKRS
jgi:hypothetical protein